MAFSGVSSVAEGNAYLTLSVSLGLLIIAALFSVRRYGSEPINPDIPFHGKEAGDKDLSAAAVRWFQSSESMIRSGLKKFGGRPFQVLANERPYVIIPQTFMEEIRNDERLKFSGFLVKDFFTSYPGFDGFKPAAYGHVFNDSVRLGLAQSIGKFVPILADDVRELVAQLFPIDSPDQDWREAHFSEEALKIIARLSARAFLGEPLCRNEAWLKLSVEYALDFFQAAYALRKLNPILRPLAHWWLPQCKKLREDVRLARATIEPELEKRRRGQREGLEPGADAFSWMEQTSKRLKEDIDLVEGQLNYSLGAVHTTNISLVAVFYDVVSSPEYVQLLRQELVDTFHGWNKETLTKLRMMDSCMKESQRMHPTTNIALNRVIDESLTLSDGTYLPKGLSVGLVTTQNTDEQFHDRPDDFIGRRFFDLRQQPGQDNNYQFVTTSNTYNSFGHGKHACPGRFFASNEIKIIMSFMLMNYDIKFVDGKRPPHIYMCNDAIVDPTVKVLWKPRRPEVRL